MLYNLYFEFPVPEFIDPAFANTSPKRSFSMTENECFGLVFTKAGSINSGTGVCRKIIKRTTLTLDPAMNFCRLFSPL